MKKYTLFFALLLFGATTAMAGGPWTQSKGKGYFKLSEWWIVFDQHYTDSGLIDPNVTTGIFNTALYAEYGLSDRFTGIVYAPLFSRNYMNNLVSLTTGDVLVKGEALNSIGDIDLSLKYGLTKPGSRFPVSATLLLGIPTGKTGGGDLGNLQTGDGEFNQMLQIDTGTGFQLGKISSYVSASLGVNNRSNGFSEELRYGIEGGLGLLKQKLWLIGRLNGVESFKNGETAETTTSTSIFANNSEYTSFSVEANYLLTKKMGVSVSYATAFRGEIIAAAPSYSVGVFLDLSK
ncbi:MAG: hypothetical protein AB8B69_26760 [Chitinophagales bacterium]